MTTKNTNPLESITDDQIDELVRYLVGEFGLGLSGDELGDSIRLVMENIPGIELVSTQTIHQWVNQIRERYDDEFQIHRNQD
jgi:hypothetical protein